MACIDYSCLSLHNNQFFHLSGCCGCCASCWFQRNWFLDNAHLIFLELLFLVSKRAIAVCVTLCYLFFFCFFFFMSPQNYPVQLYLLYYVYIASRIVHTSDQNLDCLNQNPSYHTVWSKSSRRSSRSNCN